MNSKQVIFIFLLNILTSLAVDVQDQDTFELDLDLYGAHADPVIDFVPRYSQVLNQIRARGNQEERLVHGFPMLGPKSNPPQFMYIVIDVGSAKGSMFIAINKADLSVAGYCDTYDNKGRAFLFSDLSQESRKLVFPNVEFHQDMPIESGYGNMTMVAGIGRERLRLGLMNLEMYVLSILGREKPNVPSQASFLLAAIQMLSEAAIFPYIEEKLIENPYYMDFTPNEQIIALEDNLETISKSIYKSQDGVYLDEPLNLFHDDDSPWRVTKLDEIKPQIAILAHVE